MGGWHKRQRLLNKHTQRRKHKMTHYTDNRLLPVVTTPVVMPEKRERVAKPEPISVRARELLEMLTWRRPHNSWSELRFIGKYILPLGAEADEYANYWLKVGDAPILWSSHTDTVHDQPGIQRVLYGDGLATTEESNCLGADCTVGVWLMVNMIRRGVPGTYVFHRGEECGGVGSGWISDNKVELLSKFKYAIAFDRRGGDDVITHQMFDRCCSEAFAESLCDILHPLKYAPSEHGSFTDTANYREIIPECTNISVGYLNQHMKNESQDVHFAEALLDTLCMADWSTLVCERDPKAVDDDRFYGGRYGSGYYPGASAYWGKDDPNDPYAKYEEEDLRAYVFHNPGPVARFLAANGYAVSDIQDLEWERWE